MTAATPPVRVIKARRSVIENVRRELKTAPLTAWFGMIVIRSMSFARSSRR